MPVALRELVEYLDGYLRIREVPDEPTAVNGLQVENSGAVSRIVAAVDASLATIEGVAGQSEARSTLLLVHHGLFWDGNQPVTGRRYRKLQSLLSKDIAVYSAHIPLDLHAEVGNNVVLARQLGLEQLGPFDLYRGVPIGVQGESPAGLTREGLVEVLDQMLGTRSRLIPGGPPMAGRVGVITGGGGNRISAARQAGLDTFITGEGPHHTFFDAMELGVNAIFAGHYATEQVGVQALAEHLEERFGLAWEFHAHPTGL
ncbi:MAG: Nif3-like dinuclear metal center hexameric protein [Gemmatimonadota bacterium]